MRKHFIRKTVLLKKSKRNLIADSISNLDLTEKETL